MEVQNGKENVIFHKVDQLPLLVDVIHKVRRVVMMAEEELTEVQMKKKIFLWHFFDVTFSVLFSTLAAMMAKEELMEVQNGNPQDRAKLQVLVDVIYSIG